MPVQPEELIPMSELPSEDKESGYDPTAFVRMAREGYAQRKARSPYVSQTPSSDVPIGERISGPGFLGEEHVFQGKALTGEPLYHVTRNLGLGGESVEGLDPAVVEYRDRLERSGILVEGLREAAFNYAHKGSGGQLELILEKNAALGDAFRSEMVAVSEALEREPVHPITEGKMVEKAFIRALNSSYRAYASANDAFLSRAGSAPGRADVNKMLTQEAQKGMLVWEIREPHHALTGSILKEHWDNYVNKWRGGNGKISADPKFHSHLAMLASFRIRVLRRALGDDMLKSMLDDDQVSLSMTTEFPEQSVEKDEESRRAAILAKEKAQVAASLDPFERAISQGSWSKAELIEKTGLSAAELGAKIKEALGYHTKEMLHERYEEVVKGAPGRRTAIAEIKTKMADVQNLLLERKQKKVLEVIKIRTANMKDIWAALGGGGVLMDDINQKIAAMQMAMGPDEKEKFNTIMAAGNVGGVKEFKDAIGSLMARSLEGKEGISKARISEATDILLKALSGQVTIDGFPTPVMAAISAYSIPFTAEELFNVTTKMAYRGITGNRGVFQRVGRNFDEDNPDDDVVRRDIGHRVHRAGAGAAMYILRMMAASQGPMTPSGFRSEFRYDKIPELSLDWFHIRDEADQSNLEFFFGR